MCLRDTKLDVYLLTSATAPATLEPPPEKGVVAPSTAVDPPPLGYQAVSPSEDKTDESDGAQESEAQGEFQCYQVFV